MHVSRVYTAGDAPNKLGSVRRSDGEVLMHHVHIVIFGTDHRSIV